TLSLVCLPNLLQAQWTVGPSIVISVPSSDFSNVSDVGGGFGLKIIRNFSTAGGLGLRGDFAFLNYGRRKFDQISGFVAQIRNQGFRILFGPDYSFGGRNLEASFGASAGFYFFQTDVNFGLGSAGTIDEEVALGWNIGGGISYDIGLGPWLDVSVRYQTIFDVNAPESETSQDSPGKITAHEFTVRVGVVFFIGR
ncbi:outer membrane beta-barrel protein, partial [bacterium]|nr:outer membrane beta-barrel protein [bacterium]